MTCDADLVLRIGVTTLACVVSSCASSAPATPSGAAQALVIASQPYTLQPGEEKYYCYTTILEQDTVFDGFAPTYGKGTHHILLAESIAVENAGFAVCDVLFKDTWIPLFVGGKGTTPVSFPSGSGFKVVKGTPIVLQLHLQNPGVEPITDTTRVSMHTVDPSRPFTPAGIFGMDNRAISIPPQAVGYSTRMTCAPKDKTLNVFSTFAHMHKHGQHITVTRNLRETVYDADWNFDQQYTIPSSMTVAPNDTLQLTCSYVNTTPSTIAYGESSEDEMCAFIFYYTPFDVLDGCIQP